MLLISLHGFPYDQYLIFQTLIPEKSRMMDSFKPASDGVRHECSTALLNPAKVQLNLPNQRLIRSLPRTFANVQPRAISASVLEQGLTKDGESLSETGCRRGQTRG